MRGPFPPWGGLIGGLFPIIGPGPCIRIGLGGPPDCGPLLCWGGPGCGGRGPCGGGRGPPSGPSPSSAISDIYYQTKKGYFYKSQVYSEM